MSGKNMAFENFTVASTERGLDLVGARRQILALAEEYGATTLTFRGTFANARLAERFGKAVGDAFEITVEASDAGLRQALRAAR